MSGHIPRKRFGQNFLTDNAIIHAILAAIALQPEDHVVEIGPGQGALTKVLLNNCQWLHALEIDRDLISFLTPLFDPVKNMQLIETDALKFNFSTLKPHPIRIVGNIPYNISTPLIFHLNESIECIQDMHLMVQQEVADRLTAKPNSKQYGRLSVINQLLWDIEQVISVPAQAFYPPPKVESAVIRLQPTKDFKAVLPYLEIIQKVTTQAFSQRRKTLNNSLGKLVSLEYFKTLNIDPKQRAENLAPKTYLKIANYLSEE